MKVSFIGRVAKDAKVTSLENGKQVINFSVAINEGYTNKEGQWIDQPEFVQCAYWKKDSKMTEYLTKGKSVQIEGRIEPKTYVNKKKENIAYHACTVRTIKLIGSAPKAKQTAGEGQAVHDDLPF